MFYIALFKCLLEWAHQGIPIAYSDPQHPHHKLSDSGTENYRVCLVMFATRCIIQL